MASVFDHLNEPLPQRVSAGLSRLAAVQRAHAQRTGAAAGLTPTQGRILAFLERRSEGAAGLGEIAADLAVTPATASEAVQALVRKGLVAKTAATVDRRGIAVRLSEAGVARLRAAGESPDAVVDVIAMLPVEEQAALLRVLVRLIRELQVRGEIPIQRVCVTCRYFRPYAHDDPSTPHHCAFVNAAFGDRHLRLDCREHEPAPDDLQAANRDRFEAGAVTAGPRAGRRSTHGQGDSS